MDKIIKIFYIRIKNASNEHFQVFLMRIYFLFH